MLRLDVLQNQWLILALVGGTALVLFVALAYVAVWRVQRREAAEGEVRAAPPPQSTIPWIVIVFWVAAVVYAAVYIVQAVLNPPTW
jgi:F0F1-type ATP synthase assembly protein I